MNSRVSGKVNDAVVIAFGMPLIDYFTEFARIDNKRIIPAVRNAFATRRLLYLAINALALVDQPIKVVRVITYPSPDYLDLLADLL